jgi:hypothetical protein
MLSPYSLMLTVHMLPSVANGKCFSEHRKLVTPLALPLGELAIEYNVEFRIVSLIVTSTTVFQRDLGCYSRLSSLPCLRRDRVSSTPCPDLGKR